MTVMLTGAFFMSYKPLRLKCLMHFLIGSGCMLFNINVIAGETLVQVTNVAGAPIENAVVYFEPLQPIETKLKASAEIAQKSKTFIPFVSVIQVGTSVTFPNKDSVRHHVYSFSPAKKFELKLYSGVPTSPIIFDQAGTVVLGCNIHDSMLAYVYVVDTPYFVKTALDGKAKFTELPNGEYTLKVLHLALKNENVPVEQAITIKDSQTFTVKIDIK